MTRINLADRSTWPKIGSTWEHRNGNIYRVMMFTNRANERQDEYPTTITYMNVDNQELYSRRLDDWERSMTWLGDVTPREIHDAQVYKISLAMAEGKDSGGYDTLLDMYAHIALKELGL